MANNEMLGYAEKLKELREEKSRHEETIKILNEQIGKLELDLIDIMVESDTPSFDHAGTKFSLKSTVYASIYADSKEECFNALRQNGAGELIHETVNSNTFSAYVRELMEENNGELPEFLVPYTNVFKKNTVALRKSSSKTK